MLEIIDEMCELVYVADIETYELLYINTAGKYMFNITDKLSGQKCYKMLQNRESPCPFCTNHFLSKDNVFTWEYTNPIVNRHYLLKDKLINWKGHLARIEIAFDNTDNENEKTILKNTLESERLMMDCIRQLHLCIDLELAIRNILKNIGKFLKVDRTYIFEIRNDKLFNTFEWCANGIKPQMHNLQGLDATLIDNWKPYFEKNEYYIIEDIESIRTRDPEIYKVLLKQNVHSLITAPLEQNGNLTGYIGVDNPPVEKINSVLVLFYTLRYFLMSSMNKTEDRNRLTQLSYHDPLTGAFNRNRYNRDVHHLIEEEIPLGIVYLDINGLKDVNDRMGHSYGDNMIASFAEKVQEIFTNYKLYRLGGDEFVVLCRQCSKEGFYRLVLKLKNLLLEDSACNAAVGYNWSESSKNIEHHVSLADAMMYEDKKNYYRSATKSNRYRHYNDDALILCDPNVLQNELALGHFHVYFKPKFSLTNHTLIGAEALIRYSTSNGNIITYDQFVPFLDELHLLTPIDFYIFEAICSKIADLTQKGLRLIPICMSFSKHSLSLPNFMDHINEICDKYKVDKQYLVIELSESYEQPNELDLESFLNGNNNNNNNNNNII